MIVWKDSEGPTITLNPSKLKLASQRGGSYSL